MTAPGAAFGTALRRAGTSLPALVPYFTAGFPTLAATPDLLLAAERSGCAAAEVGIPFSDPLADGPTIQRSSVTALRNGATVASAIAAVRTARDAGLTIPVAFMTYCNPVLAHGLERFADDAAAAGADGVIVPDLPLDEAGEFRDALSARGLAHIPLVAPTTPEQRLERICETAEGFVYCVGVTGVTGARREIAADALRLLAAVGERTSLPRALGFGISRHEHLDMLRGHCEAVVVGSALIEAIDAGRHDPAGAAARFITATIG